MAILVVEDNRECRALLFRLLTESGHEVLVATNVREALILLAELRFGAFVTDMDLPDGNGFEVLAEAQKNRTWKKAIALTGRSRPEEKAEGLRAGFDEYLTKPFDIRELETALAAAG